MKTNQNYANEAVNAIDVSALIYTNIEYDISREDLHNQDEFKTIKQLRASLPQLVRVDVDEEDRSLLLEAIENKELTSLEEVWDWISNETGWCVCGATVTTIDNRYSE